MAKQIKKKSPAGRKPVEDKKVVVNLFIRQSKLDKRGELMGLNSMFGALQVLHQIYTWNPEWKVLIHCQAGKNRSPTIKSAFHYMMLGEHEADKTKEGGRNNRLIDNCKREHLPPLEKTELFLSKCKEAFDHPEKFFGGMFDWVMSESGCSLK